MAAEDLPHWLLLSVLFSTQPLTRSLALSLHRTAVELYRTGGGAGAVEGPLLRGEVRNLRKEAALGTLAGPVFEADIETERGSGKVRFLVTRQGLEAEEVEPPPPPRPAQYLS